LFITYWLAILELHLRVRRPVLMVETVMLHGVPSFCDIRIQYETVMLFEAIYPRSCLSTIAHSRPPFLLAKWGITFNLGSPNRVPSSILRNPFPLFRSKLPRERDTWPILSPQCEELI
jgi:hypothetical protein